MIADTAPPLYGGAGTQAALLASRLRALGHDVTILARQKSPVRQAPGGTVFVRPFVPNSRLSSLLFALSAGWRVLFSRADVVHCHGAYSYAWAAVTAARLRHIPAIVKITLVGSDDPASIRSRRLGPLPVGRWMSSLYRRATCVIVMNEHLARLVAEAEPAARVEVLPNGVELPSGPTPDRDVPSVVFVGVLSERKGIDTLMGAWPEFLKRHPDADLTLIGPPGDATVSPHRQDRVTPTGLLSPAEARRVMSRAGLFVLPSRQEGQPNALVEAMSLGIPSVASDIPENRATGGDAAVYFPVGDSIGLVAALDSAWADRVKAHERGRAQAARFDIDRVSERCSELYERLTSDNRRRVR